MLPKPHRLKSKGEFKRTLSGKRLFGCSLFVLYGLERQSLPSTAAAPLRPPPPTRIGFIVSKKIHKRATQRNRIRRRLRELVRLLLITTPSVAFPQYRTLVFIARPDAIGAGFKDLKRNMDSCWQRLSSTIGPAHYHPPSASLEGTS